MYVLTEFEQQGGTERASGRFPSKGFEVQVYNGTGGPRTGSLYHVVDFAEPLVKDDEWFTQTVIVNGDSIVGEINEKQVVSWTQPADWTGGAEGPDGGLRVPARLRFRPMTRRARALQEHPHQATRLITLKMRRWAG